MWQVFAGEQGFVDAGLPFYDQPVGWQHGSRLDQHPIAQAQLGEQNARALAVFVEAQTGCWQQIDQLCSGRGGAFAGAALQIATGEEEQGEHAHGIEIEIARAGDCSPDSCQISPTYRQGNRHVHGQVSGADVTDRATEERLARVENDGRGEEHGHPAQDGMQLGAQVDIEFRPGGHRRHHRLEPQQAGYAYLAQRTTILLGEEFAGLVRLVGVSCIADLAQFGEQGAQR
ncbi:hypothetical protein FQZ97_827320 [compost metagenome]